jgi:hypothetical protein
MRQGMKMWMFNCKEVSQLVSQSMDRELSFTKRMGIRFHLMMCRHCARFVQQLELIRQMIHTQKESCLPRLTLDAKVKTKLNHLLEQRKKEKDP